MPTGNFAFNVAKGLFAKTTGQFPAWDSAGGGTADFLCIFVGGGGGTNGLDAAGAEDADTLGAIAGIATYQFNGANYTANGIALATRTVTIDDTNDRAKYDAADTTVTAMGAGTGNGATVTDIIIAYEAGTATFANYVPILRIALPQTYTGQGADFTIQWPADGIFYIS